MAAEPVMPAATNLETFLDRLTHRVHILDMNGDSFRLAQSNCRSGKARPEPSSGPPCSVQVSSNRSSPPPPGASCHAISTPPAPQQPIADGSPAVPCNIRFARRSGQSEIRRRIISAATISRAHGYRRFNALITAASAVPARRPRACGVRERQPGPLSASQVVTSPL